MANAKQKENEVVRYTLQGQADRFGRDLYSLESRLLTAEKEQIAAMEKVSDIKADIVAVKASKTALEKYIKSIR